MKAHGYKRLDDVVVIDTDEGELFPNEALELYKAGKLSVTGHPSMRATIIRIMYKLKPLAGRPQRYTTHISHRELAEL